MNNNFGVSGKYCWALQKKKKKTKILGYLKFFTAVILHLEHWCHCDFAFLKHCTAQLSYQETLDARAHALLPIALKDAKFLIDLISIIVND